MLPRRHFASGLVAASICLCNLRSVFAVQVDSAKPKSEALLVGLIALIAELSCSERLSHACQLSLGNPAIPLRDRAQLIIASLDLHTQDYSLCKIKNAVRTRILSDFEQRKILDVDGWCLSLTETRLYAMAGFIPPEGQGIRGSDPQCPPPLRVDGVLDAWP